MAPFRQLSLHLDRLHNNSLIEIDTMFIVHKKCTVSEISTVFPSVRVDSIQIASY